MNKKTVIVTGGSRGIGKAMALKLGELGYNVAINYRSDSSKQLTEDLIEETNIEDQEEASFNDLINKSTEDERPSSFCDFFFSFIKILTATSKPVAIFVPPLASIFSIKFFKCDLLSLVKKFKS